MDAPEIYEYIQEYLDLIEFANGGMDTKWGMVRAEMGHEAPFGLEMVGVGNEQWEDGESHFFERYELFEKEIHKVYPEIKLIGTAGPELDSPRFHAAWEFYHEHENKADFVYAVDEHYYIKPDWFLEHTDYFDHVSRGTKVFFGEYAAHSENLTEEKSPEEKSSNKNNLEAALAEAAFMTGMERNSDVVVMTCYAPLLARVGYAQWNPDLIWFDESRVCRTPSYYVQQMFAKNLGDYNIELDTIELDAIELDAIKEKKKLFCQAGYDIHHKELIVKLVNVYSESQDIQMLFDKDWKISGKTAKEILLTGKQLSDSNTVEREVIQPQETEISLENGSYQIPPFAFSVLRIPMEHDSLFTESPYL